MSNLEMGKQNPEYQFGQETIVKITAEKLAEISASSMPESAKVDAYGDLHRNWDQILEGLDKEQGH